VPHGADQTLYLVMDAEGPKGQEFQIPVERPDLDSVIADLMGRGFPTRRHLASTRYRALDRRHLQKCRRGNPVPL